MKKEKVFTGVATALVTPQRQGEIDFKVLGRLIERQIEAGVDAIVIGGTTGEAATLTTKERYALFEAAKDFVGNRCKLILGTGTNDTAQAVSHTEFASTIGCDGVLVVTPYYNRGTKEGLLRHYEKIAAVSRQPVILYNVPSRTGTTLDLKLLTRLSKIDNIAGIKEASDSTDRLTALSAFGDELWLYAGNDSQIYTTLCLGGCGVISVISNLYPKETREICKQFFANNRGGALEMQLKMLPVINTMFLETNPAPIKYAMSKRGLCSPGMRLPMWLPTRSTRRKIQRAIDSFEADKC